MSSIQAAEFPTCLRSHIGYAIALLCALLCGAVLICMKSQIVLRCTVFDLNHAKTPLLMYRILDWGTSSNVSSPNLATDSPGYVKRDIT